jgi:hypothetical protein
MNITTEDKGVERFDYKDKTYLLISGGQRGHGMHEIEVHNIIETEDDITFVVEVIPPKGEAPDVVENPRLFMYISQTNKDIKVKWR